jgi:hypothetical protein
MGTTKLSSMLSQWWHTFFDDKHTFCDAQHTLSHVQHTSFNVGHTFAGVEHTFPHVKHTVLMFVATRRKPCVCKNCDSGEERVFRGVQYWTPYRQSLIFGKMCESIIIKLQMIRRILASIERPTQPNQYCYTPQDDSTSQLKANLDGLTWRTQNIRKGFVSVTGVNSSGF